MWKNLSVGSSDHTGKQTARRKEKMRSLLRTIRFIIFAGFFIKHSQVKWIQQKVLRLQTYTKLLKKTQPMSNIWRRERQQNKKWMLMPAPIWCPAGLHVEARGAPYGIPRGGLCRLSWLATNEDKSKERCRLNLSTSKKCSPVLRQISTLNGPKQTTMMGLRHAVGRMDQKQETCTKTADYFVVHSNSTIFVPK